MLKLNTAGMEVKLIASFDFLIFLVIVEFAKYSWSIASKGQDFVKISNGMQSATVNMNLILDLLEKHKIAIKIPVYYSNNYILNVYKSVDYEIN